MGMYQKGSWNYVPWCQWGIGEMEDEDGHLLLAGQKVEIRWILQTDVFKDDDGDTEHFTGLAYDRAGNFYGVLRRNGRPHSLDSTVEKLHGKAALSWFARHFSWDAAFSRELCKAIDSPQFEFMSLVPQRVPPKRKRKARKAAQAFHEQLHMATAMVECVRKLEDAPTLENLAEACRSVSALHQAIHAPENFKLAANS